MRPSILNLLFCQIESLKGVGSKIAKRYHTLCGSCVVDLLHHLPSGVNFRPIISDFNTIRTGDLGTLCVEVDEHITPPTRRQPYRVMAHTGKQSIELVFFNYHKDYLFSLDTNIHTYTHEYTYMYTHICMHKCVLIYVCI